MRCDAEAGCCGSPLLPSEHLRPMSGFRPSAMSENNSQEHPETLAPSRCMWGHGPVLPLLCRSPEYPAGPHTTPPTLHHTTAPRRGDTAGAGVATRQSSRQSVTTHRYSATQFTLDLKKVAVNQVCQCVGESLSQQFLFLLLARLLDCLELECGYFSKNW